MASLAEMMFQQASQNIRDTKGDPGAVAKSFASGVQLAQKKQQLKMQQEKIQNTKALAESKMDQIGIKEMETYSKLPPKLRKTYAKQIQKNAEQRGRPYAPEFIEGLNSINVSPQLVSAAKNRYDAEMAESLALGRPTQGLAEARADFASAAYGGDVTPLAAFEEQEERARIVQEATTGRTKSQITARADAVQQALADAPIKKVKEKAGSMFADYKALGGESGVKKKLDGLRSVLADLESGKLKTRTKGTLALASVPFGETINQLSLFNPDLRTAVDKVRGAISLKGALDSNFSKAEAEQVYARAFDINATVKQNKEKVRAMIDELEQNEKSAGELFKQHGLMGGEFIPQGAPQRQTEAATQVGQPNQATIEQAVEILKTNPETKDLNGDELLQYLDAALPKADLAVKRAIIKQIQLKDKPGAK